MTAADARPRVVYLLSVQNSGSTALDAILGAAPGCTGLGEMAGFGRIAAPAAPTCDCGRAGPWCAPCTGVLAALDAEARRTAWVDQLATVLGGSRLRWTILGSADRRRYAELSFVAIDAAAEATGATTVVDASKNVARAAALLAVRDREVRIVHLVRDPRGYLRSRERRAERLGHAEGRARLLAHWVTKNGLAATVIRARAGRRYLRVRLEDLLDSPATELARIGAHLEVDLSGVAEAAVGAGVERTHLYEPNRALDYRTVRLDPNREADGAEHDARAWWRGGFVGVVFGYRREGRR